MCSDLFIKIIVFCIIATLNWKNAQETQSSAEQIDLMQSHFLAAGGAS
jgi:hypothetical protein